MDTFRLIRKCLAVGIILLFVGTSILLTIAEDTGKNQCFNTTLFPTPISKTWMKTFGGPSDDCGYSVQQTTDGGYIVTGYTEFDDVWLIKTDGNGHKIWDRTFGGSNFDWGGQSVQQTTDGGYIIGGITSSFGAGEYDFWLIKTNVYGKETWNKTFGGVYLDSGYSVQQTSDGGYIIAGATYIIDEYGWDFWVIKTDSNGEMMWNKTFGGAGSDEARSVQQTSDGGYIIVGYTNYFSDEIFHYDVWLIKTDGNGNEIWNKTLGGNGYDEGWCVQQTTDGGYIITGNTAPPHKTMQFLLIKTNSYGEEIWNKTYGGTDYYIAYFVEQTADGGYVIIGETHKSHSDNLDAWLVKTDGDGNKVWDRTFGGLYWDEGRCVQQTTDGGYIIAGSTSTSSGLFASDVWLIKTDGQGKSKTVSLDNLWFNRFFQRFPNAFPLLRHVMGY